MNPIEQYYFPLSILLILYRASGEPGAYPGDLMAQGGLHPGRGADPSQGGTTTFMFDMLSAIFPLLAVGYKIRLF